jgi:HSP20 family protein
VLTVKAERTGALRRRPDPGPERPQGSFTRQLVLSDAVDHDRIEARYDGGVLLVTVPFTEAAKPHRIEVKASDAKAITASEPVKEPATV